jgi:hypothetical protein
MTGGNVLKDYVSLLPRGNEEIFRKCYFLNIKSKVPSEIPMILAVSLPFDNFEVFFRVPPT